MRPIHTRDDLIGVALNHAPTSACATAIRENRVTVLGGFNPVEGFPGWIVEVKSKFGQTWLLAILLDEAERKYRVRRLGKVPWECWVGKPNGRSLNDGDYHANSRGARGT